MKLWVSLLTMLLKLASFHATAQKSSADNYINIEIKTDPGDLRDSLILSFRPVDIIDLSGPAEELPQKISQHTGQWKIETNQPVLLYLQPFPKNDRYFFFFAEPGDDVVITAREDNMFFSGRGSEKFALQNRIRTANELIEKWQRRTPELISLQDYFERNKMFDLQLKSILALMDSSKQQLSPLTFNLIKAFAVDGNIGRRTSLFGDLQRFGNANKLSYQTINAIYDSIYYPPVSTWFSYTASWLHVSFRPVELSVHRKYNFDWEHEVMKDEVKRRILTLEEGLKIYKRVQRERFIQDYFGEKFLQELGPIPETETFLAKYYAEAGYPEYKIFMKGLEQKSRKNWAGSLSKVFTFWDKAGNPFIKKDLSGKISIINFWQTDIKGCDEMAAALKKIKEQFRSDTNVVFIHVGLDDTRQQWLKGISEGKYTASGDLQLYAGKDNTAYPMIEQYIPQGNPTAHLVDPSGRQRSVTPEADPRKDEGSKLKLLIQKQVVQLKDGPYVTYKDDLVTVSYLNGNIVSRINYHAKQNIDLEIQTDIFGKTFFSDLKETIKKEPSQFEKPKKIFVLSDIEGNFDAFRKLLQVGGVIDEKYNWVFASGHLVFAGDMFDRGWQVTECLWLIYSLEEKAKAGGGYVHFILGNHEIMNLQGDDRYVREKYKDNAALMGRTLVQLYNEDTELGQWLRTKNVVVKIGDLLFMHAGISRELNQIPVSVPEINQLARPYYAENRKEYGDKIINTIMSSSLGPFWYRGYYGSKPAESIVDSTLQKFNVKRIITGHTIVADTISVHYGSKVINTDTKHAEGKSEALLIVGDKYYRVNQEGKKVLLFIDDKKNRMN